MRRYLLLLFVLLLTVGMVFGLTACSDDDEEEVVSYSLDSSAFNSTVALNGSLSLNGLTVIGSDGSSVAVSADMVSGSDTSTAGAKELTISYHGVTFTVGYTVKYKVTFVIEGEESVQLVNDVSEIVFPEPPAVVGKQFNSWSSQLPAVLTGNIRIDAIYKTLSSATETAYTWTGNGIINLQGYASEGSTISYTVTDADGNVLSDVPLTLDTAASKISYSLGSHEIAVISISGEGVMAKSWRVEKTSAPSLNIAGGIEAVGIAVGEKRNSQKISAAGSSAGLKYTVELSNANVNAAAANGYLFIDVLKAGVTELTLVATNETNELESVSVTQYVVVTPKTITITNNTNEYGIEDIWTIGRENVTRLPALSVYAGSDDSIGDDFYSNLYFVTGNDNVSVNGGVISLADVSSDPDIVEVKAVFGYNGVVIESAPMKIRCVYNGVNVYNYGELYTETKKANPRPIVLQNNIKDDFSSENYTVIQSTYDLDYYKNIYGVDTDLFVNNTAIKVLVEFKNNVYGNGYEINAHNATIGTLDATGNHTDATLFRGPLNFVAMTQSGGAISVKGQDNIVFAVYENVTLNNIVLKSCDLESVDGQVDLTDLEYAGTTVEVLGDNVTIEYSRILNGRILLRVFGDVADSEQAIHLTVKNTMLKGSREFNARIGSNRFVSDPNVASPLLPGDSGNDYSAKKRYNNMSESEKAAYDEKYINTYVVFENVVFEDAGILSIALDAHFAGEALHNGSGYLDGVLVGWYGLAKTSYGAKVTLKDDVRLYSWKPIESIDSSTLLENNLGSDNAFSVVEFNIREILEASIATNPAYSNIIYKYGGENYIHAGIAFFGGGKNYSVVENALTSNDIVGYLQEYEVAFKDLGDKAYFAAAAGNDSFYFLIYNSLSDFTYEKQINMQNKYSCLYK